MNTIHKGIVISSEQIAHWLDAANDEEFGEAIVWFWKKFRGDYEPLEAKDFEEFDTSSFIVWLEDLLDSIVPMNSEFNETAWWKTGGERKNF